MPQQTNSARARFGLVRGDVQPFHDEAGYTARCLFNGETCVIIEGRLSPGSRGPARHVVAQSDQVLFVVEGQLQVEIGADRYTVGPETLVFVPMGTSLHFWNEGGTEERHLHVLTRAPVFGQPVSTPADAPVTVGQPLVRHVYDVENASPLPTMEARLVLSADDGSEHAAFPHLMVPPEGAGPPLHYHEFDMFYFITERELTIKFGLDGCVVARPGELVAIPAGVPHAQLNKGTVPEKHLAVNAPHPKARPWDIRVNLTPAERND